MGNDDERLRLVGPLTVLYWFDFGCPFCYVGQPRNDLIEGRGFTIVHLPFQMYPEIPPEGIAMGRRSVPMYASLEREAAQAGLPLKWPSWLPDTRTALSAAEWVRRYRPDVSGEFNARLFAAHFALGEDLGDRAVIDRYVNELGIDAGVLNGAIADGSAPASFAESVAVGARFGVQATPSWLIAGELVSGLLPLPEFERCAESAMRRARR